MVVHADMDAFYAAVEQLDDPSLRGRPVLVGGTHNRGVVLTASYEARPWGVGSAMPMMAARRLCPEAVVVPPRFERYTEVSQAVFDVFDDFSPSVEALGLDEAFLDMSGCERIFGGPERIGRKLKDAVREATGGLAASVGVSGTKYVAKVASDYSKPDGLLVVPQDEAVSFLAPLPVSRLWGAGPKTTARLKALGFSTIGDVAAASPASLAERLGAAGSHFHQLAHAQDVRRVEGRRRARSLSTERTLLRDISGRPAIEAHLRRFADELGRRLRRKGLRARGVRVKLKTSSFALHTRQVMLAEPTDLALRLYVAGAALIDEFEHVEPYRLVGLGTFDLVREGEAPIQTELFSASGDERRHRLETALDALQARFGPDAVLRAEELEHGGGHRMSVNLDFLAEGAPPKKPSPPKKP
jgi:DNA polymerase IV